MSRRICQHDQYSFKVMTATTEKTAVEKQTHETKATTEKETCAHAFGRAFAGNTGKRLFF